MSERSLHGVNSRQRLLAIIQKMHYSRPLIIKFFYNLPGQNSISTRNLIRLIKCTQFYSQHINTLSKPIGYDEKAGGPYNVDVLLVTLRQKPILNDNILLLDADPEMAL